MRLQLQPQSDPEARAAAHAAPARSLTAPAAHRLGRLPMRRRLLVAISVAMFAAIVAARFLASGESEPILLLAAFPVALIAIELGMWGGLAAGAAALATWWLWAATSSAEDVSAVGLLVRGPVFLLAGALVGKLADLDAHKLHELAESERDLRFIAEESADMISTHDADGDYVFVSGQCRPLLGYEPHELVGSSAYVYFHPDDVETVAEAHAATLAASEAVTTTYRLRRKDGHYVWVQTKARARRDPTTGDVEEIHCATRDASRLESSRELDHRARVQARQRIARCLAGGGPAILYQPILDLTTREIVGVEALARFHLEPQRPPNVWFEEAWSVGLGLEMELAAIREALASVAGFPDHWDVSLNASPETVQAGALSELLRPYAERVVIEVTEYADIGDPASFTDAVARLREHGVCLAIDDIGTGFSGLSRLLELAPDVIKLDLTLTRQIDRDPRRGALASALVAFGEESGIRVVAEGIETEDELEALRSRGVRFGQGYHLARPAADPTRNAALASRL